HVVRRADVAEHAGQRAAIDLRPNESEASGQERPDTGAARSAERHADNDVAHEIDHAVAAEVVRRPEEAGTEAERELTADNAFPHSARVHTETDTAVV